MTPRIPIFIEKIGEGYEHCERLAQAADRQSVAGVAFHPACELADGQAQRRGDPRYSVPPLRHTGGKILEQVPLYGELHRFMRTGFLHGGPSSRSDPQR